MEVRVQSKNVIQERGVVSWASRPSPGMTRLWGVGCCYQKDKPASSHLTQQPLLPPPDLLGQWSFGTVRLGHSITVILGWM